MLFQGLIKKQRQRGSYGGIELMIIVAIVLATGLTIGAVISNPTAGLGAAATDIVILITDL